MIRCQKFLISILFILMADVFASAQGYENMDQDFSNLELMISKDQIQSKIIEIAQVIDQDYKDKEIVFLIIMKGAFIFAADFVREIKTPFSIETIFCSSYGNNGKIRGQLSVEGLDQLDLKSRHVLIIDDICDSGKTLESVTQSVIKKEPASVKSIALLLKNIPSNKRRFIPDYYLFEIDDKFVIGYGLDYKEYFRGLKEIYFIE